jgi:hypothetical protein
MNPKRKKAYGKEAHASETKENVPDDTCFFARRFFDHFQTGNSFNFSFGDELESLNDLPVEVVFDRNNCELDSSHLVGESMSDFEWTESKVCFLVIEFDENQS